MIERFLNTINYISEFELTKNNQDLLVSILFVIGVASFTGAIYVKTRSIN